MTGMVRAKPSRTGLSSYATLNARFYDCARSGRVSGRPKNHRGLLESSGVSGYAGEQVSTCASRFEIA